MNSDSNSPSLPQPEQSPNNNNQDSEILTTPAPQSSKHDTLKKCYILILPYELVTAILSYVELKDLVNCALASKDVFPMLDPDSIDGQSKWKRIRLEYGFPDPALVEINSDFDFFKLYTARGCDFCSDYPYIETIFWRFGAKRFCEDCFRANTKSHRWLYSTTKPESFIHLPYEIYPAHSTLTDSHAQRYYFVPDILDAVPNEEEIKALKAKREKIELFIRQFKRAEDNRIAAEEGVTSKSKLLKRKILRFLKEHIPEIDEGLYKHFSFLSQVHDNPYAHKDEFSRIRLLKKTRMILECGLPLFTYFRFTQVIQRQYSYSDEDVKTILDSPDAQQLLKTIKTFPTIDESLIILEPFLEKFRIVKAKRDFVNRYATSEWPKEFRDRLVQCAELLTGDPCREKEAEEGAKAISTEAEQYLEKKRVQHAWEDKFSGPNYPFAEIYEALTCSEAYKSGDPNREEEVVAVVKTATDLILEQVKELAQKSNSDVDELWSKVHRLANKELRRLQTKTILKALGGIPVLFCYRCYYASKKGADYNLMSRHIASSENCQWWAVADKKLPL